ncbi:MAG: TetR family transcriptional regulator [Acidimicrobiales bacterium]|jgi:AcrR family transcriptional regulator
MAWIGGVKPERAAPTHMWDASTPVPEEDASGTPTTFNRGKSAGLRERKKEATREALSMAALRLALERGIANVRVGDIAAAAGVSPRTYNNYFSNREQAICALGAQRALRIVSAFNDRPAGESLAEALVHAMVDHNDAQGEPDKDVFRLMACDEVVRGEWFKATAAVHRPFADAIAARAGMDAAVDLLPHVVASAYEAAARAAMQFWLRPECTKPFASVLRDALTVLAPVAEALERAAQPASGQPASGQPASGQPASGQPASGQPASGQRHLSRAR